MQDTPQTATSPPSIIHHHPSTTTAIRYSLFINHLLLDPYLSERIIDYGLRTADYGLHLTALFRRA